VIYRFGIFEADVLNGQLLRRGMKVRIQDQPFRLLIALLEADGNIVGKDALRSRLWPSDTYIEVDTSLSVAVAKLREALGDEAANPRFIETVPRRGYRFVAPVHRLEEGVTPQKPSPTPAVPDLIDASDRVVPQTLSSVASPSSPRSLTRRWWLVAATLAAAAASWLALSFYQNRQPSEKGLTRGVVISEFINSTGDSAFDGSLRQALIVGLTQSPTFVVHSDAALDEALQGLGRPPALSHVTPAIARQACLPLGADFTMTGSIDGHGTDHYVIAVEVDRLRDGRQVTRTIEEVVGRDRVLPTIGHLLTRLRQRLGESKTNLQRFNVALEQATTDSLDALNAYRVGLDLRSRGKQPDSIPLFKAAIVLDPKFAMAYEQPGSVFYNVGEQLQGARYLQRAFDLRDRITEPERLLITGRYFDVVTGEVERALEVYSLWQRTYPLEWLPYNETANDEKLLGRYELGIQAARKAIELEPNHAFGYANLAISLMGANRFREARAICQEAMRRRRDNSELHRTLYELAFVGGNTEEIVDTERFIQNDIDVSAAAAMAAAAAGRIQEAKRRLTVNAEQARMAGNPGAAAYPLGLEALLLADVGDRQEARRAARAALSARGGSTGFGLAMVAFAVAGDIGEAEESARQYDRTYPLSIYNLDVYRPSERGALAALRHLPSTQVKELMAAALPYELGREANLIPTYIRAQALLAGRDCEGAIVEFQKLLDHRGVCPVSPYLSLAHLGLARAHAALKNKPLSCREYQQFMGLWRQADSDIPIRQAAIHEYVSEHCPAASAAPQLN